jgi:succinate-acetate transporter protein
VLKKSRTLTTEDVKGMSEKLANPAPLGLLGFGLTTVLLNLHNAGLFPLDTMILAMGLAYGGLAQIIVGAMEFKKGNTFGTVAFTSYGLFWWSLVALLVLPSFSFTGISAPTETAMAAYFFLWGLFTFAMFFGTLKTNRALQFVFASLTILFFMPHAVRHLHPQQPRRHRRRNLRSKRRVLGVRGSAERDAPKNRAAH